VLGLNRIVGAAVFGMLRLEHRPLPEVVPDGGLLQRTRWLWRRLLPMLESPRTEHVAGTVARLALRDAPAGLDRRVRHLLAQVAPRARADLAVRIVHRRGLRFLRRCDRYFESKARGVEFVQPSVVSVAIGGSCNLRCEGCYSVSQRGTPLVPIDRLDAVFQDVEAAGAGMIAIAGPGEPFLDTRYAAGLLACIRRHPGLEFIVFTNGSRLGADLVTEIAATSNLLCMVSVDGLRERHDERRGRGSFDAAFSALSTLHAHQALFGFCATVHGANWREVTSPPFAAAMAHVGCVLGVYNEVVPLEPGCTLAPLDDRTRADYLEGVARLVASAPFWVIESRSMEERRYGCRAKKGTSCHIDAVTGQVSPCPLFPYSSETCRLESARQGDRLLDILRDPFFVTYRAGHPGSRHCTRGLEAELERLLSNSGLGPADRRQVEVRLERARTRTR
jgi:MoaA/NifB/PqqE/SkfB family radical SAM enzyme